MPEPGLFGGQWYEYRKSLGLDDSSLPENLTTGVLSPTSASGNSNSGPDASAPVSASPAQGTNGSDAQPSSFWNDLVNAGEAIWTSPNTALGVLAGMAGIPFGARPTFEHGAVVFNDYPWGQPRSAATLGDAILTTENKLTPNSAPTYAARYNQRHGLPAPPNPSVDMGAHEEGHVHQAGILGPFYLPTYAVQGLLSNGPSPMEKAADTYGQTGKGWWPW